MQQLVGFSSFDSASRPNSRAPMFAFNSSPMRKYSIVRGDDEGASSSAAVGFKRFSRATTVRVGGARGGHDQRS